MPRRIRKRSSLLVPAGDFLRRLADHPGRIRRRLVSAGFVFTALFLIYVIVGGTYGLPRILKLELQRDALVAANRAQMAELVDTARRRDLLRSDPTYIEYLARTRYHMAYPNETVYRYRQR